ncbi:MAG: DUF47 family protein [Crenarchaeota archaeon]|nr:DUF47 family protein [Thermoproteota archaeon]
MSSWSWLAGRRLKEIVNKSFKHLELVNNVVSLLDEIIDDLIKNNIEEGLQKFDDLNKMEEKADVVKREIFVELRSGYIHPLDREDLLRLILTADDIAAYAKAAARRIVIIHKLGYKMPEELLKILKQMTDKIVDASKLVIEAVNMIGQDPSKALSITHEIEDIEESVDDLRMEAYKFLYKMCKDRMGIECILYKEVIDDIENTSDRCEDTADVIRMIAVSI